MKIGMMSTWNVPCGASLHAHLVGNAWIQAGHNLTVFAPYGVPIIQRQDEPWIIRNYTLDEVGSFDLLPLSDMDYDIFVLQHIPSMPMKQLLQIASKIKEKAKTVVVIHEGRPLTGELRKFPWDAIVCFDKRYKSFLKNVWAEEKINIIPYPCHPVEHGDKIQARKKLGLPLDKMILMVYGVAVHHYFHILPFLERVNKEKPLIFLVFTGIRDWFDLFETARSRYEFIKPKMEILTLDALYTYLHASDALIYHRDSSVDVVVASTIYVCMGAGCPILASASNFVETLKREVLKYKRLDEFEKLLLKKEGKLESVVEAATKYVNRNSADKIAMKFIRLFKKSKEGK